MRPAAPVAADAPDAVEASAFSLDPSPYLPKRHMRFTTQGIVNIPKTCHNDCSIHQGEIPQTLSFFGGVMKHLVLVVLLVCSPLAACTRGNESTQAAREPRMTDSDLKNKIESRINSDPQLRDADLSVSADADKNTATISGTVATEAMRSSAIEMAKSANP